MRKLFHKILFTLNIIAASGLLLAHLSTHISPTFFWPLAFFGLIYPFLILGNIIFLLLWTILWKKYAILSLIIILTGFNHLLRSTPVLFNKSKDMADVPVNEKLKVMSFNVRAFNIYEWLQSSTTNKDIFNFIRSEYPDVICIQEYYTNRNANFHPHRHNELFANTPYNYIEYSIKNSKNTGFGIATFSKYPIVGRGSISFPDSYNRAIYTDILFNGDTVRVYNTHLQSVSLRANNYNFIDSLRFGYHENQIRELQDLSIKLKSAYIKRAEQAAKVTNHRLQSAHPVIVCGDFNDTPVSFTYHKMSRGLKDAFLQSGKGRGNTYLGRFSLRIDYILYDKGIEALEFSRIEAVLSDHYPILSTFRIY